MKCLYFVFFLISTVMSLKLQAAGCYPFSDNGTHAREGHGVSGYRTSFKQCSLEGGLIYTIRKFKLNRDPVQLVVDGRTMASEIVSSSCLKSCEDLNDRQFLNTVYGSILSESGSAPYPLQNDGITQGRGSKVALTVDMCPSSRGFSNQVYATLIQKAKAQQSPVPIGIAMTRAWKKRWGKHFRKLKEYQAQGYLAVEWINHSSNHKYRRGVAFKKNFLLIPGTDMPQEVLGNEISLIRSGVTPSPYFRFPGLVSNQDTVDYVTNQGLITLGSKAWLAKGERPKPGSIILIHGNRNEPVGETELLSYMKKMKSKGHSFGHLDEAL